MATQFGLPADLVEGDAPTIMQKVEATIPARIPKVGDKWEVLSEDGKPLGTYDTKSEAEERPRSVEYWKHARGDPRSEDLKELAAVTQWVRDRMAA